MTDVTRVTRTIAARARAEHALDSEVDNEARQRQRRVNAAQVGRTNA